MKAQMREANRQHADYALFVGKSEVESQVYGLKNLRTSEQDFLSIREVIARLASSTKHVEVPDGGLD